ncbi:MULTISPECIES: DUF2809 domain-containing protein [unclassified Dysgonomonas]|uniref:ribosomal maturation YjgA family protein n=1 Tax=unclassified Dysgonomonas TaxID=2630389 RepID=UPI00247598EF|nr:MULTISPECIES: DUF2809 domain-containing protein [unclassified Dysgonomonas]
MENTADDSPRKTRLRFALKPFLIFLLVFVIEVFIALFVRDSFVRPFGGDILVVVMMYYFVKSFIQTKPLYIAVGVLLFAFAVEVGQYFNMIEVLGMQDNKVMRVVIGSSYSTIDLICYTVGASICYFVDFKKK